MAQEPFFIVARGPVPRDLSAETKNVRSPRGHGRFLRRSMHGEGQALALRWEEGCFRYRSAGACPRAANCLEQDSQDLHDLQDYLSRNEHSFCNGCLFRSFRTCMSIEKRVLRSFQGPLGP